MIKLDGIVFRMKRAGGFPQRLHLHDAVDTFQRVPDDHCIFTGEHDLSQSHGDNRRKKDVKYQIQQKSLRYAVPSHQQRRRRQKGEYALNGRRIDHHRHAQFFCIVDDPFFVIVYGAFKSLEGKDRLAEGLYD
ncbi:hypothetical protein SDC9_197305 [bioreactor metagenome]|uniref:Uncharacterized protein n=1 Tax=bioreactor metagenome TaxID=1076179 RepID=A0A645IQY7_9ZZZZ